VDGEEYCEADDSSMSSEGLCANLESAGDPCMWGSHCETGLFCLFPTTNGEGVCTSPPSACNGTPSCNCDAMVEMCSGGPATCDDVNGQDAVTLICSGGASGDDDDTTGGGSSGTMTGTEIVSYDFSEALGVTDCYYAYSLYETGPATNAGCPSCSQTWTVGGTLSSNTCDTEDPAPIRDSQLEQFGVSGNTLYAYADGAWETYFEGFTTSSSFTGDSGPLDVMEDASYYVTIAFDLSW
jgi:hypothetical protein